MLEFLVQIFGDLCFELAIAIGDCTWECCCVLYSEAGAVDVFAAKNAEPGFYAGTNACGNQLNDSR